MLGPKIVRPRREGAAPVVEDFPEFDTLAGIFASAETLGRIEGVGGALIGRWVKRGGIWRVVTEPPIQWRNCPTLGAGRITTVTDTQNVTVAAGHTLVQGMSIVVLNTAAGTERGEDVIVGVVGNDIELQTGISGMAANDQIFDKSGPFTVGGSTRNLHVINCYFKLVNGTGLSLRAETNMAGGVLAKIYSGAVSWLSSGSVPVDIAAPTVTGGPTNGDAVGVGLSSSPSLNVLGGMAITSSTWRAMNGYGSLTALSLDIDNVALGTGTNRMVLQNEVATATSSYWIGSVRNSVGRSEQSVALADSATLPNVTGIAYTAICGSGTTSVEFDVAESEALIH